MSEPDSTGGWEWGKWVVDSEIAWVSRIVQWIAFMEGWRACSDLESSANCWSLSQGSSGEGRSSKHNLIGIKSFPVWGAADPKHRGGGLSIRLFPDSNERFVRVLFNVLFVLFTWLELWDLYAQWSFQSIFKALVINWEVFGYESQTMSNGSIAKGRLNQGTRSWRSILATICAILIQVGNTSTH